jgi:hypothetical protein
MEDNTTPEKGESESGTEQTPETPGTQPEAGKEGEAAKPEPTKPESEEEPPVRKTPLDYILERKAKKLESLKAKRLEAIDKELAGDEQIDPDEESKVDQVIQKKYGQHFEELAGQKVKAEVAEFLNTSPIGKHLKEFEAKIVKYAQHPSRSHLPLEAIAYEVAGPELLKIGAKLAAEANKEAAESKAGGTTARKVGGGKKDYLSMSDKEMEEEILRVKTGGR